MVDIEAINNEDTQRDHKIIDAIFGKWFAQRGQEGEPVTVNYIARYIERRDKSTKGETQDRI